MDKQQKILQLLKQNAPAVYAHYVSGKIPQLQNQIQELRNKYAIETNLSRRSAMSIEAMRLKEYLKLLASGVGEINHA